MTTTLKVLRDAVEALEYACEHKCNAEYNPCMYQESALELQTLIASLESQTTRTVESDYTSHVAYTRALEAYCDGIVLPVGEPVAWFAFSDHNGPVPLELYGWDKKACKHAVLTYARAGNWKGTVEGYLMQQGWTLRPVYDAPVQPIDQPKAVMQFHTLEIVRMAKVALHEMPRPATDWHSAAKMVCEAVVEQPKAVPLTDFQIGELLVANLETSGGYHQFARAIELFHGIGGGND